MPALFPSLISCDILKLDSEIKRLSPYCDGFHLDIMDGHFVHNLTWGPIFVNAIRKATDKPLWVHLMVDAPGQYVRHMRLHRGDMISFHLECAPLDTIRRIIKEIELHDYQTSIAIKPTTPIADLIPLFTQTPRPNNILVMSVEPGASGQPFLPNTLLRLKELVALKETLNVEFTIALDGGITPENVAQLAPYQVDAVAVAAGIFGQEDQIAAMKKLRQ